MKTDFTAQEFAIIDSYLRKELKGAELLDFEEKLLNNPHLQEKVKEVELMQLAIGEVGLEAQLNALYAAHNIQKPKQERKSIKRFSFKLFIAATLAVIIGISLYYFVYQKKQTLYAKYYKPDPGLMTVMSYATHYDFQKAMVEYKNGNYNSAINTWHMQLKTQANQDTLLYFLGAAYQAKGKIDSAEIYLLKIMELPKSAFYNEANWYLGLIYLQKDDKEKAIEYIKNSNHANAETLIPLIAK